MLYNPKERISDFAMFMSFSVFCDFFARLFRELSAEI